MLPEGVKMIPPLHLTKSKLFCFKHIFYYKVFFLTEKRKFFRHGFSIIKFRNISGSQTSVYFIFEIRDVIQSMFKFYIKIK